MNEVATFEFPGSAYAVRTLTVDGEPWFVLADVCGVLGIANPRNVAARLPKSRKDVRPVDTLGGQQYLTVVDEPGAYMIVMRSDKASAVAFQEWLAEVATSIRKTGQYEAPATVTLPRSYAEALRELAATVEERDAAHERLAITAPKAEAFDAFQSADGTYSFEQVAKMLHAELGLGRNNLMRQLRAIKVLEDSNLPYQQYAHHFHVVAQTFEGSDGRRHTTYTTRVFPSGVEYIRRRLAASSDLPLTRPAAGQLAGRRHASTSSGV